MSLLSTDMHEPLGDDDPSKNNKPYGKVILTLFQNYKPLFQNCNCFLYWCLIYYRRDMSNILPHIIQKDSRILSLYLNDIDICKFFVGGKLCSCLNSKENSRS